MRRWLIIILLLMWTAVAGAQTTPPMCSITGNVANPDGSPYVGVIKFDSSIVQIINNIPINPIQVSTGTNASGVIQPISLPQGAFFKVTVCPSASAASGCAATFTAIVPASASANFGNMAQGVNLSPSVVASSLSVTGATSLANTTINGTLGIGAPAPTTAGNMVQITGNGNQTTNVVMTNSGTGSNAATTYYLNNDIPHYAAFQLTNTGFTVNTLIAPPDTLVLGTNAANGIALNSASTASTATIRLFENSTNIGTFSPTGLNLPTGESYQINGNSIWRSGTCSNYLEFGGATTGITYNSGFPYCNWWRIGPLIWVQWGIWIISKGTATGNAQMCGLPFPMTNAGGNHGVQPQVLFGGLTGITGVFGFYQPGNGQFCATFVNQPNGGSITALTNANFLGGDNIQGSYLYVTDAP